MNLFPCFTLSYNNLALTSIEKLLKLVLRLISFFFTYIILNTNTMQKICRLFSLFFLVTYHIVFSQTVNVTASNTGCKNSGIITTTTSGITSPTFQLQLADGTVISPVAGDSSVFSNSNIFTALANGTYKVIARDNVGTLFTSANVVVTDGYTNMTITANTVMLSCVGAIRTIPVSVAGGKSPFIYEISDTATSTVLQTSASTAAASFTFNALPLGSYSVKITDVCGVVVVSNVQVTNPSVTVSQLAMGFNYYQHDPTFCSGGVRVFLSGGFWNGSTGAGLSATERAFFTYKIKYGGQLYGMDTNADGFSDLSGNGYSLSSVFPYMPLGVLGNDIYNDLAATKIVVFDQCGNSKEFSTAFLKSQLQASTTCLDGSRVRSAVNAGILCTPVNFTFTNTANPSDVLSFTQTTASQFFTGFTAGATYTFTFVDANGNSSITQNFSGNNVTLPNNSTALTFITNSFQNTNVLGYGTINITPSQPNPDGSFNFQVTASNNPLVPVGFSGTAANGTMPKVNTTDPNGFWPKGTYTIKVTSTCGTGTLTMTVDGRIASLSGNTITPICGGFNYVMTGNFDVSTAYEVVIISGPSNVGLTQDLASTTASTVFVGLAYGTYTAGLRIKGGSSFVATQTFSFGQNGVITVDKDNSGGFVCTSGGTDGTLTIIASSISPFPNNILEYRISADGGVTYSAWQSSNIFSGLTNITYTFQLKDGCGFVITDNIQVGAVSAPQASANIGAVCELDSVTVIQLGVDTANANYLWVGPGINAGNQNMKNPILNINDLAIGPNNYTVTVTAPFCANSSTASTVVTKISSTKPTASTGTELPSLFGISTKGSTDWKSSTKNGAMVLESSDKGFVITRLKTSELPTGANAVKGMIVYDTDVNCMKLYNGSAWSCITRVCP